MTKIKALIHARLKVGFHENNSIRMRACSLEISRLKYLVCREARGKHSVPQALDLLTPEGKKKATRGRKSSSEEPPKFVCIQIVNFIIHNNATTLKRFGIHLRIVYMYGCICVNAWGVHVATWTGPWKDFESKEGGGR